MSDKYFHKDYDIVNRRLAPPFSQNGGKSRSPVIVSFGLHYDKHPIFADKNHYTLQVSFVFFTKRTKKKFESFDIRAYGATRKQCFDNLRNKLRQLNFIGGLALTTTR